jgi:HEAT repeat protein
MNRSRLATALTGLESPVECKRRMACWTLGELGLSQAVQPLVACLGDHEALTVRLAAANALARTGDPSALSALELTPVHGNSYDAHGDVSAAFAAAATQLRPRLSASQRQADIHRLVKGLGRRDANVAQRCVRGLTDWGVQALDLLTATSRHPNPRVRGRACQAIGGIGRRSENNDRAVGLLLQRLGDTHAAVRVHAAKGFRHLDDERVAPRLIPFLRDPEPRVRLQAMRTLGSINAFEAMPELERMACEDRVVVGLETRLDSVAASVLEMLRRKLEDGSRSTALRDREES